MGFIRLYLALCVVSAHSYPLLPWGMHIGREAVQLFFMISGFYMALSFPKYQNIYSFYKSRFLRIYIPYFFILISVVVVSIVTGVLWGDWAELNVYLSASENNGFTGVLVATIANIFIFGQDIVMFISHDIGSSLSFTTNFRNSSSPLYQYLILPTAWSLPIELIFYLCTPFIIRMRTGLILIVIILISAIRIIAYRYGYNSNPWNCRFFPFEMSIFCLGIITYRSSIYFSNYYNRLVSLTRRFAPKYIHQLFLIMCIIFIIYKCTRYLGEAVGMNYSTLISYVVWAPFIAYIFQLTKDYKFDRQVGEISYPLYLIHIIVIYYVKIWIPMNQLGNVVAAAISIILSLTLIKFIIAPLDKKRLKLKKII